MSPTNGEETFSLIDVSEKKPHSNVGIVCELRDFIEATIDMDQENTPIQMGCRTWDCGLAGSW